MDEAIIIATIPAIASVIGAYIAARSALDKKSREDEVKDAQREQRQQDQPLDLSGITSIGSYFLSACYSFNQPLTLGSATCGTYFMFQCYSFTRLNVGSSTISSNNYSLSGSQNTARMYVEGVTLTGANASTWKSTLANRTSNPYRKLIDGTA